MLNEKQKIPTNITLFDSEGKTISSKELLGKITVLYFYPKDDTPGCTMEACEFRDANTQIQKMGIRIIGISKDSPLSHQKFKKKYNLPFQLWSDPEHKLQEAFGVWQEKKFMGKKFMGTVRATFIIDKEGIILKVYPKVTPKGHAEEVLNFIKTIL